MCKVNAFCLMLEQLLVEINEASTAIKGVKAVAMNGNHFDSVNIANKVANISSLLCAKNNQLIYDYHRKTDKLTKQIED